MQFENREICTKCGGKCCKHMGCHYSPMDFKDLSYEGLKKEIDKGHISIDWWNGNPFDDDRNISRVYYLRVRNIESEIVDGSWGGRCSLLTENGCSLTFNDRPKGGRKLIPQEIGACKDLYTKKDCVIEWYEYNETMTKLAKEYKTEDSFEDLLKLIFDL